MKTVLISGERFYSIEEANLIKEIFLKASFTFEAFGYDYINLSHFEPYEYQELSFGEKAKEAITFKDSSTKETFGLRLDFTTQVVRTISNLKNLKFPEKLYYFGSVFSLDRKGFEKLQTGVELIGINNLEADVEVIQVLVEFLRTLEIKNVKVILSHAGIVRKLAKDDNQLLKAFFERDVEKLKKIFGNDVNKVLRISDSHEILEILEKYSLDKERETLKGIGEKLKELGISFAYDLCEVRHFPYYTGVIFEIYELKYHRAVAGGGRYDNLSTLFGKNLPATGGTVYLERLIDILPKAISLKDFFIIDKSEKKLGKQLANVLRGKGKKVAVELVEREVEDSVIYAFEKGYREILLVDDKKLKVFYTPKEYVIMTVKEFLKLIQ